MTRRPFKNALCLVPLPDFYQPSWHEVCHRRANHEAPHRVRFRDGGSRVWKDGDIDSQLEKRKRDAEA